MIGTEFLHGQGLGNQLFCYVTARAIATDKGVPFGMAGQEFFANTIHDNQGMYFMDVDLGHIITENEKANFIRYNEENNRLYLGTFHDLQHGCYIMGADLELKRVEDNTLIYGNMQDESYFDSYYDELKKWLVVKEEYDTYEFSKENLCILHFRGGDYFEQAEFTLKRSYWLQGMRFMKKINPDMEFMLVTNDPVSARKILPEIPAYNFDIAKDFAIIKNAHYLLLSNSSFACMPAFLSNTIKYILAPKYWGRYNVSDGYWCGEQNIYRDFHYMDRRGRIFTAAECRHELEQYKATSRRYRRVNQYPQGIRLLGMRCQAWIIHGQFWAIRIVRSARRRMRALAARG
ncbi:MAG: glycosyl transferase [Lachnospiraceae bacterium]|jgi:hypothetical protein|nr:glycosyl transferase [Lachnospiraceae bacterium]